MRDPWPYTPRDFFEEFGFQEFVETPGVGEWFEGSPKLTIWERNGLGEIFPGGDMLLALTVVGRERGICSAPRGGTC